VAVDFVRNARAFTKMDIKQITVVAREKSSPTIFGLGADNKVYEWGMDDGGKWQLYAHEVDQDPESRKATIIGDDTPHIIWRDDRNYL